MTQFRGKSCHGCKPNGQQMSRKQQMCTRDPKLDSEWLMRCRKVAKGPKIAGDALSKTGGNLDHHHHHLACSTVPETVQRLGQQVQGPVDIGYQVRLQEVLYWRKYAPGIAGSTVLKAVHIGKGLYRARNSLYCSMKRVEAVWLSQGADSLYQVMYHAVLYCWSTGRKPV